VKRAGIGDGAVRAKTGKTWADWLRILDKAGARAWGHAEIARHLHTRRGLPGWWSQMVAVGYEQARGLREKQQTPSGYQVSVSRTLPVPVGVAFRAWKDARTRARWLPEKDLVIHKSTPNKSLRLTWTDGAKCVEVNFYPRPSGRSIVSVQHRMLKASSAATKMKRFWSDSLDRMRRAVSP